MPVIVVVKIGTSSITDEHGEIAATAIEKLCSEVAHLRGLGHKVVVVTSGAIAAGLPALGLGGPRPTDLATLQAVSAVGQSRLMRTYDDLLGFHHLVGGQVLLAPLDFVHRSQYLHARQTLTRLLDLGVVPVVNENDAVADDEIRFGDNDRLAALVAHLVGADLLVLLTDTPGVLTADPRLDDDASLIEEIVEVDHELERVAGGTGGGAGSGGMASKLAAAKIAAWSGVPAVIAAADRPGVLAGAVAGEPASGRSSGRATGGCRLASCGSRSRSRRRARSSSTTGPAGPRRTGAPRCCRPAWSASRAPSTADDAVEIAAADGVVFAKGLVRHPSGRIAEWQGRRSGDLPADVSPEVIHRDDLVVLP